MSKFNDISWRSKDNEQECKSNANLVSISARGFSSGRWSFLGLGLERKWYSTYGSRPQGEWDRVAELMMINFQKADAQFSVPRVHWPEERSKAKEVENYQYTCALMRERLKLFFAQLFLVISSVFTEQSQKCVKNVNLATIERGDLYWQDNLTHCLCQQVCWRKHLHLRPMTLHQKIYCKSTKNEWKGSHNKIVWLRFVLMQDSWQQFGVRQYFMTKDTEEFSQFTESVTCREYTSPRDEK